MTGSSFGHLFRVTTAGESHGPANVVIVDGVPSGLPLDTDDLLPDLQRRRPGQSSIVSQRDEPDRPQILSGVFEGITTGAPIAIQVPNRDARPKDYDAISGKYRPGHGDHAWDAKYGLRDWRGGGRASARETVSRVAAGAVARKLLERQGVRVTGWVKQIGGILAEVADPAAVLREQVEASLVRCPDPEASRRMVELVERVRGERDTVGCVAEIAATGVPAGWGEPVFDKLKADLGKALFSIPAVVGVEVGAGFTAATSRGSEHNDPFIAKEGAIRTRGNRHGGILGGISSGMPIVLRCALKPPSSLPRSQPTVTREAEPTTIETLGRHDPCLGPRFVPVGEAMVAITLADHWLRQRAARLGE